MVVHYINRHGMYFEVRNAVQARVKTKDLNRVYYVLTPEVDKLKTRELLGLSPVHHSHLRGKVVIAGWTTQYPWQFPLWSSKKPAPNYNNKLYESHIFDFYISTYIYDSPKD